MMLTAWSKLRIFVLSLLSFCPTVKEQCFYLHKSFVFDVASDDNFGTEIMIILYRQTRLQIFCHHQIVIKP